MNPRNTAINGNITYGPSHWGRSNPLMKLPSQINIKIPRAVATTSASEIRMPLVILDLTVGVSEFAELSDISVCLNGKYI